MRKIAQGPNRTEKEETGPVIVPLTKTKVLECSRVTHRLPERMRVTSFFSRAALDTRRKSYIQKAQRMNNFAQWTFQGIIII